MKVWERTRLMAVMVIFAATITLHFMPAAKETQIYDEVRVDHTTIWSTPGTMDGLGTITASIVFAAIATAAAALWLVLLYMAPERRTRKRLRNETLTGTATALASGMCLLFFAWGTETAASTVAHDELLRPKTILEVDAWFVIVTVSLAILAALVTLLGAKSVPTDGPPQVASPAADVSAAEPDAPPPGTSRFRIKGPT